MQPQETLIKSLNEVFLLSFWYKLNIFTHELKVKVSGMFSVKKGFSPVFMLN